MDAFVVMPIHIHGILIIDKQDDGRYALKPEEGSRNVVETRQCLVSTPRHQHPIPLYQMTQIEASPKVWSIFVIRDQIIFPLSLVRINLLFPNMRIIFIQDLIGRQDFTTTLCELTNNLTGFANTLLPMLPIGIRINILVK